MKAGCQTPATSNHATSPDPDVPPSTPNAGAQLTSFEVDDDFAMIDPLETTSAISEEDTRDLEAAQAFL